MLVLHATWFKGELCIWAEDPGLITETSPGAGRRRAGSCGRPHPFAARIVPIAWAVEQMGPASTTDEAQDAVLTVTLPSTRREPLPSQELAGMASRNWSAPLDGSAEGPEVSEISEVSEVPRIRTARGSKPSAKPGRGASPVSLAAWTVAALRVPPEPALEYLAGIAVSQLDGGNRRDIASTLDDQYPLAGASLHFWADVARLALDILADGQYAPDLSFGSEAAGAPFHGKADLGPNHFQPDVVIGSGLESAAAVWVPLLNDTAVRSRVRVLSQACPPVCMACPEDPISTDPEAMITDFLRTVVDSFVRQHMSKLQRSIWAGSSSALALSHRTGPGPLWLRWARALASSHPGIAATSAEIARFSAEVHSWIEGLPMAPVGDSFRTCFRLEPPASPAAPNDREPSPDPDHAGNPEADAGADSAPDAWTISFHLQASDDPSLLLDACTLWRSGVQVGLVADRWLRNPQERLLADIWRASAFAPELKRALNDPIPIGCELSPKEAYRFLKESVPLLQQAGYGVLVPPWWNNRSARLGLRIRLKPAAGPKQAGASRGLMSASSLIDYDWKVSLGSESISPEEFARLAALKAPLVQIRGQWVELRPEDIEAALAFFRKRKSRGISLAEALRLQLHAEAGEALQPSDHPVGGAEATLPVVEVESEGWVSDLLAGLSPGVRIERVPAPANFVGTLRPYQERGLSWLAFLSRHSLGGCLADDMGLGKTIQVIALLLHEREDGCSPHLEKQGQAETSTQASEALPSAQATLPGPTLLVCPMSVVENWKHELARFAPTLRVMIHHGCLRLSGEDFARDAQAADIVVSTYALANRDREDLARVNWERIVLDEAQNIKNPDTKQAKSIRSLSARCRLALTGTPVENHLGDMWSIMEFLNPGYLPGRARFKERYATPIEKDGDQERSEELRRMVRPFILRRVKTDPSVIQDLPDKIEMKVFCSLTREQATLYQAVVDDMTHKIKTLEGFQRRGLIFSTIMKLKQICNHPAQFLQDRSALHGRSGKLSRLEEMLEEIIEAGDRALVFTQFAEAGKLLQPYLQQKLGRDVLLLHGGTPKPERDAAVARFQDPCGEAPVFILSIKAGGVGLNLTQASHVFHFDRWWNPAVENQATDRAFRIGQVRNVQVHKYICAGTLEERIDQIIEDKKALAQQIVGAGESWLAELSTDDLRGLLELTPGAMMEESNV
ncbi:MAG: DEAD/DEAH box helicase [Clostridia bacterium]|nr:DEAD/DEAH box helicase [Clostridia bacterium]